MFSLLFWDAWRIKFVITLSYIKDMFICILLSYGISTECYTCEPGTYKDTDDTSMCTYCPAGSECTSTTSK